MLDNYFSLVILDLVGACGIAIGIMVVLRRFKNQRMERF
jgi:hypothetical protein